MLFPILNCIGSQPLHANTEPPTAETLLLHGIKLSGSTPSLDRCCGPARQIPAPLSGNMRTSVGLGGLPTFGRIGVSSAGIS